MKTIPVVSETDCCSPEDYFLAERCPRGLPLAAMRVCCERGRAVVSSLLSCGEDTVKGFTIRHDDVMCCLDTIDSQLKQLEAMIENAEEELK